jgi:phosphatidylinositol glycan class N
VDEGKGKEEQSERLKVSYLPSLSSSEARLLSFQLAGLVVALCVVISSEYSIANKTPTPSFNRAIAWLFLASVVVMPFIFSRQPSVFFFNLFLCFVAPFTFLSISYEVLFYCALSATLYAWYYLEASLFRARRPEQLSSRPTRAITLSDARISLFFLYLCYVAFFGTGNIASISSFEVSSTFRFMTIFNPWSISALLIIKLVLPFVLVSCIYHTIVASSGLDLSASFLLVIAFSDVLSLNFLFLVRDTGSWRDIGTSISHFAISNCFILFHLGVVALSSLLTSRLRLARPLSTTKPNHLRL